MTDTARDPVVPAGARILVTGAGGMLGRAVAARLARLGCQSRLLVRRSSQRQQLPASAEVIVGDVSDTETLERALEGMSVVLHLAAATRGNRAEFEATNIAGTRKLLDACLKRPACRLVHVSSIGVLDHAGGRNSNCLREDAPLETHPEQRGDYTRTKLAAETLVRDAVGSRGLNAVILRPGQILGPGCETVAPNGVVALRGWNLVGDGCSELPLVYVDDVVDALLLAGFQPGISGEVFHIVDPTSVTQDEYLSRWRARVTDVSLRRVPWMVALGTAWCVEILCAVLQRQAPLTRYRVRSLRPLTPFDVDKASRLLGWRPRVGVRAGLDMTFGAAEGAP